MKNVLFSVAFLASVFLGVVGAAPSDVEAISVSWDRFSVGNIRPLNILDTVWGNIFHSTSTTQASTFPYASTTVLSATTLCITSDCRTSWPSSGVSTSTVDWIVTTSSGTVFVTDTSNGSTVFSGATFGAACNYIVNAATSTNPARTSVVIRPGNYAAGAPCVIDGGSSQYAAKFLFVGSASSSALQVPNSVASAFHFQNQAKANLFNIHCTIAGAASCLTASSTSGVQSSLRESEIGGLSVDATTTSTGWAIDFKEDFRNHIHDYDFRFIGNGIRSQNNYTNAQFINGDTLYQRGFTEILNAGKGYAWYMEGVKGQVNQNTFVDVDGISNDTDDVWFRGDNSTRMRMTQFNAEEFATTSEIYGSSGSLFAFGNTFSTNKYLNLGNNGGTVFFNNANAFNNVFECSEIELTAATVLFNDKNTLVTKAPNAFGNFTGGTCRINDDGGSFSFATTTTSQVANVFDNISGAFNFLNSIRVAGDRIYFGFQSAVNNFIEMGATTWNLVVGGNTALSLSASGVQISDDADGAMTFTGQSTGFDESLTWNFDDASCGTNCVGVSSASAVTQIDFGSIGLTAYASSTIGSGAQAGGLTVSGGATTTGALTLPALAAPAGAFLAVNTVGRVIATTTPSAGSGTYPFTPTTHFGTSTSATSTPLFLRGSQFSLFASSTAVFTNASTTRLSVVNNLISQHAAGFLDFQRTGSDFTLLRIRAPRGDSNEATLSLVNDLSATDAGVDEEFVDIYNERYEDALQWGMRQAYSGTGIPKPLAFGHWDTAGSKDDGNKLLVMPSGAVAVARSTSTIPVVPFYVSSSTALSLAAFDTTPGTRRFSFGSAGDFAQTGTSGTFVFAPFSDGGDYNFSSSNGTQTLALFGSAAATLHVNVLDGNLRVTAGSIGVATTSPEAKVDVWGASSGKIMTLFSNTGTKFMEMLNTGVTTLLGTWNFSGATVKVHTYASFTYATSTTFTGTTTIPLGPAYTAESWSGVKCFTDTGTLNVVFSDGTNLMNLLNASTTVGSFNLTTNNTFTASEKRFVDIGTPASSPTKISCTVDHIVNN